MIPIRHSMDQWKCATYRFGIATKAMARLHAGRNPPAHEWNLDKSGSRTADGAGTLIERTFCRP